MVKPRSDLFESSQFRRRAHRSPPDPGGRPLQDTPSFDKSNPSRAREAAILLILIALPCLVHLPELIGAWTSNPLILFAGLRSVGQPGLIPGLPTIDPNNGFTTQALGYRAAMDWLSAHPPWWNPYEGVGTPLAGEMQSAALFPLVLLIALPRGLVLFHLALQVLAGLATYYLVRSLGAGRMAAVAGGAIFEFNGTFAWLANAAVNPVPFLPLALLGVEQSWRRSKSRQSGGWVLLALGLALSIYAGFPEVAYLDGLLVAVWTAVRFGQSMRDRPFDFARRVATGVVVGLALAGPILVAFGDFVLNADLGNHAGAFAHAALSPQTYLPQLVLPYIFGNVDGFSTPSLDLLWANVGGYLGALTLFWIVLAMFGSRARAIRLTMLLWIAVCLAKTFDVGLVSDVLNRVPLIANTAFYRYSPPSWELASAVLVSLTVDDIQRQLVSRVRIVVGAVVTIGVVAILYGSVAHGLIAKLMQNAAYQSWPRLSLAWAGLAIILSAVVAIFVSSPRIKLAIVVGIIALDAILAGSVPMLADFQHTKIDVGGVLYLQKHLGLQRFYTLGPIAPNYGSYFGIASINHNDAPIPAGWSDYITSHLDRYVNPFFFIGNYPRANAKEPTPAEELRTNLESYEEIGVKYVVAPRGADPLIPTWTTPTAGKDNEPLELADRSTISGSLPGSRPFTGTVTSVGVLLGNYGNTSDGVLRVQLCQSNHCSTGQAELRASADNQVFFVPLTTPLTVQTSGPSLDYRFSAVRGKVPVALWLWPTSLADGQNVRRDGTAQPSDRGLRIVLKLGDGKQGPSRPVYEDSKLAIYELPAPRPYFEVTNGSCSLRATSREEIAADCATAATLIRRELTFPGWQASANGSPIEIHQYGALFQSIDLPSGHSDVRFSYVPEHMLVGELGFVFAVMVMAVAGARSYGRGGRLRRERKGEATRERFT